MYCVKIIKFKNINFDTEQTRIDTEIDDEIQEEREKKNWEDKKNETLETSSSENKNATAAKSNILQTHNQKTKIQLAQVTQICKFHLLKGCARRDECIYQHPTKLLKISKWKL